MKKMKKMKKIISVVLAVAMFVNMAVVGAFSAMADAVDTTAYDAFLSNLEILEGYAGDYVQEKPSENDIQLVINYVRTGIAKYTTGSWEIMAGAENKAFVQYVAQRAADDGADLSNLRDFDRLKFRVPNGDEVDFAHMFGSMDVAYYSTAQGGSKTLVRARGDLSSWAGDVCDLMLVSHKDKNMVSDDVDELADMIRDKYLGEDYDYAFGQDDIYGDLDSFYILDRLEQDKNLKISQVISSYFTESLNDEQRADYFLKHRFDGVLSKHDIRTSIYKAYINNTLLYSLEVSRGLNKLNELRTACLYAFADYLFLLAGDPDAEDVVSDEDETQADNEYYTVFSSTHSNLAPGVKQDVKYALTADNKQIAYYIASVDINREDLNVYANYRNNDPTTWGMARVTDQIACVQAKHTNPDDPENYVENYNAILGVNGDFFNMTTGQPSGVLVMNGVKYNDHSYRADRGFFAILKDGSVAIGSKEEWDAIEDQAQEAIGGSLVLIKNGEIVNSDVLSDYYVKRAPRTCAGVTADGRLILMVLDGRQEPFSAGGNLAEVAQIMLDAGCVDAINLDGGGSSTYAAKQEGSDDITILNRPSDHFERSVSSSLVVVSTAEPSNKFDHVLVETQADYLTVGSSLALKMTGVSTTGNAAEIPADAQYRLSNDNVGHIIDGVFYADNNGSVDVDVVSGDAVIGSKTLNVVVPDRVFFNKTSMDVVLGKSVTLPIAATYNGNAVIINPDDIYFTMSNAAAGSLDGFIFTAASESDIKNVTITAMLNANFDIKGLISISLYDEGSAIYDFDNTMFGDRLLAWNRVVSNTKTEDNKMYYVVDKNEGFDAEYTFAIDARAIPFPASLTTLIGQLAPTDIEGVTPWSLLLGWAERVSSMTEVIITLRFDQGITIDPSEIEVVNDYFYFKNASIDESTNTLKIVVGWRKQTEAIDPSLANPICILSGIKATLTDAAAWNDDVLNVPLEGHLHYDIGLRSSTLYKMSSDPEFQASVGVHDYINPDDPEDKGGFMSYDFLSMEDTFTVDKKWREGWDTKNGTLYYFVNNEPLTGLHKLPGIEDPDNEYYYELGEDGRSHDLYTGFLTIDGAKGYAFLGVPANGWKTIDDNIYYFDKHGKAVTGTKAVGGIHEYTFNSEGVLIRGSWGEADGHKVYYWAGGRVLEKMFEIDGKTYFFNNKGYMQTGIVKYETSKYNHDTAHYYLFGEDGVLITEEGMHRVNGDVFYVEDGYPVYKGLFMEDGDYYYINSTLYGVKDTEYSVYKTNDLLPQGKYLFDAEGKLVIEPTKNGLVEEADGTYYYVDGVKTHAGLIEIDGDYYYIATGGKMATGKKHVYKTNDIFPEDTYDFGTDGKMVNPPLSPDDPAYVKNGLIEEEDGTYYYVNNVKTYAGLIKIGDDYYYINSLGKMATGKKHVYKTNDLFPEDTYDFGTDGKMVNAPSVPDPEMKNGLVEEADGTYYYVNNVKTYAGLIKIGDDYYYINSLGKMATGKKHVYKTNNLLPEDTYDFGTDGKMVHVPDVPGVFVEEEDGIYFYVDGVKTYAGLIKMGDDYYYVNSLCKMATGKKHVYKTNDLLPEDTYEFGEDGKMINPPSDEPAPEVKNGLVEEADGVYYYVDGVKTYGGLVEIDGDYYYINSLCKMATGKKHVYKTNDLMPEGTYDFGTDGKMITE